MNQKRVSEFEMLFPNQQQIQTTTYILFILLGFIDLIFGILFYTVASTLNSTSFIIIFQINIIFIAILRKVYLNYHMKDWILSLLAYFLIFIAVGMSIYVRTISRHFEFVSLIIASGLYGTSQTIKFYLVNEQ